MEPENPQLDEPDGPKKSGRLRLIIPWVLSLGFVAYVVSTVDFDQVGEAMQKADFTRLLVLLSVFGIVVFFADSATLTLLFRRFFGKTAYKDVLAIKGVSYFLNALNYSAAAGGMALFLNRRKGVPFLEALSSMIWLNFVDILVLVVMLSIGMLIGHSLLPAEHIEVMPWLLGIAWAVAVGALVYWNLGFNFLVLGRLRKWRIFDVFRRARGQDYLVMMGARFAFILLYVVLRWLTLPAFDIHIGLLPLLVYVPLETFIMIVPASVSGLGAIQEVMIAFYAPYVGADVDDPRSQVFAFSLVVGPFMTLLRLGIGYCFMSTIARDFARDIKQDKR